MGGGQGCPRLCAAPPCYHIQRVLLHLFDARRRLTSGPRPNPRHFTHPPAVYDPVVMGPVDPISLGHRDLSKGGNHPIVSIADEVKGEGRGGGCKT